MQDERIVGTWKVTELMGEWLTEEEDDEEEEAVRGKGKELVPPGEGRPSAQQPLDEERDDSDSDASEDGYGGLGDDSSGDEGTQQEPSSQNAEEVQALLEIGALELRLVCEEEGHANWELRNTTGRNFQNPFSNLGEFEVVGNEVQFTNEENTARCTFTLAFDPRGSLSFVRKDGAIMTLQKVLDPLETFSFVDALKGDRPFSDVALASSDGKQVKAHAIILEARCSHLLTPEGKELLSKFEAKVIDGLLYFLYTDFLQGIAPDTTKQLQKLAAKLSLTRLELLCEDSLQINAVKNELFQLIADFSEGLERLTLLCSDNFLESEAAFQSFLKGATKELCHMFMKFWLITVLYANRKNEMTKTEKKELLEFARIKTADLLRKGNALYTIVVERLEVPREQLAPLYDASLPDFEDLCEFSVEVLASFKQVLEGMPQETKKSKSKGFTKLLGKKMDVKSKVKKMTRTIGRMVEWGHLFLQEPPESKQAMLHNHANSFINNFFLSNQNQNNKRADKLERFLAGKMNTKWNLIVRQIASKSSSTMGAITRFRTQLLPIFQKLVDRLADPVVTATAQKLGLLKEQTDANSSFGGQGRADGSTLALDVKKYLRSGQFADMSFVVMGAKIPAHRILVACRSPHFNRSLQSGMREATEREIVIPHISPETFDPLLEYFYGGVNLENLEADTVIELLKASDEYEINPLKEACGEFLKTMVDAENAAVLLDIASTYQAHNLKTAAHDFILENPNDVMHTEEYLGLDPKLKEDIEQHVVPVLHDSITPELYGEAVAQDHEQTLVNSMLEIVGEDADIHLILRCLTAADKDLNRAVNFFYSGM